MSSILNKRSGRSAPPKSPAVKKSGSTKAAHKTVRNVVVGRSAPAKSPAAKRPDSTKVAHQVVLKSVPKRTGFGVFAPDATPAALKRADFVKALSTATTMDLVNIEREGVPAQLFEFLAKRMSASLIDVFRMTGASRSTTMRKIREGGRLDGAPGQAALGMARLLAKAQEIAEQSTHPDAATFDSARWLGEWVRKPQPALGGRKPEELLDTPTGLDAVMRVLGAIQSGAYQ